MGRGRGAQERGAGGCLEGGVGSSAPRSRAHTAQHSTAQHSEARRGVAGPLTSAMAMSAPCCTKSTESLRGGVGWVCGWAGVCTSRSGRYYAALHPASKQCLPPPRPSHRASLDQRLQQRHRLAHARARARQPHRHRGAVAAARRGTGQVAGAAVRELRGAACRTRPAGCRRRRRSLPCAARRLDSATQQLRPRAPLACPGLAAP